MSHYLLPDGELGHAWVVRYLSLRSSRLIGALWPGPGGVYFLSPAAAVDPFGERKAISIPKLREFILQLEISAQIKENAPQALPKFGPSSAGAAAPLVRKQSA